MKITKWVEIGTEVEVEVTGEDIACHVFANPESGTNVLQALNAVASVLTGVPNDRIKELLPKQKEVIEGFLREQAERYSANPLQDSEER